MGIRERNSNRKNMNKGYKRKADYEYIVPDPVELGRDELAKYEDQEVVFTGVLKVRYGRITNKAVLVCDVEIDGKPVCDHVWINLSGKEQQKMIDLGIRKGDTVTFKGTVDLYVSRKGNVYNKYGFKKVSLHPVDDNSLSLIQVD